MPDRLTKTDVLEFLRRHTMAVEATVCPSGRAQAAAIGIVVTDELEVFFDTTATSRKAHNLRLHPAIALVVGWDEADGRTVQYEGVADEPVGPELARLKERYFARFPQGREREQWPDIAYFRVRPSWIRFTDFNQAEPLVLELGPAELS